MKQTHIIIIHISGDRINFAQYNSNTTHTYVFIYEQLKYPPLSTPITMEDKSSNPLKIQQQSSSALKSPIVSSGVLKPLSKIDGRSTNKPSSLPRNHGFKAKAYCPQHNEQYFYFCEWEECIHPYCCEDRECVRNHRHHGKLRMSQFKAAEFESLAARANQCIENKQRLFVRAREVKMILDSLEALSTNIEQDKAALEKACEEIKAQTNKALTRGYMKQLTEAISLQDSLKMSIGKAKNILNFSNRQQEDIVEPPSTHQPIHFNASIPLPSPISPASSRFLQQEPVSNESPAPQNANIEKERQNKVRLFLEANIRGFDFSKSVALYDHAKKKLSCKQFHATLKDKTNLVYLFIGADMVIGSYYTKYFAGSKLVDPKSFIFLAKQNNLITKYEAADTCQYHAELVTGYYIRHGTYLIGEDGLRLSQEKSNTLQYSLPSFCFTTDDSVMVNGELELENFVVMHMPSQ